MGAVVNRREGKVAGICVCLLSTVEASSCAAATALAPKETDFYYCKQEESGFESRFRLLKLRLDC